MWINATVIYTMHINPNIIIEAGKNPAFKIYLLQYLDFIKYLLYF